MSQKSDKKMEDCHSVSLPRSVKKILFGTQQNLFWGVYVAEGGVWVCVCMCNQNQYLPSKVLKTNLELN